MPRITIDPLTRIEGSGSVEIFLDQDGGVTAAYLLVPELRGFESFCVGRPAEEMPRLTSRICGLCPEAHIMASVKALDSLFGLQPPPAATRIRELVYMTFFVRDHATHFFALAGPDLFCGPDTPAERRTFLGVLETLGRELGQRIIDARMRNVAVIERLGGRGIHPDAALPGGWSCRVEAETRQLCEDAARANIEFAKECLELHRGLLQGGGAYPDMLADSSFSDRTCYMGTVDADNRPNVFDGAIRVVAPDGHEIVRFDPAEYQRHIAEHVEPWTRLKLPYLRAFGWTGLASSGPSGIYCATPLARLNVAQGMATPAAQEAFEELRATLGKEGEDGRALPIHNRMANHWARLIELLYAAERMLELATDPELEDRHVRVTEGHPTGVGVGSVEAPRGTLFHEYHADEQGLLTRVNLVVGTTNNHAPMARSLTAAAKTLIRPGVEPTEALLNRIEMVLRAYDPCLSCATHAITGGPSLAVRVRDDRGRVVHRVARR